MQVHCTGTHAHTMSANSLKYDDYSRQVSITSMTGKTLWGTCFDDRDLPIPGTETPAHPSKHARRSSDKLPVKVLPCWVVRSYLDPIEVTQEKGNCWKIDHDNTNAGAIRVLYVKMDPTTKSIATAATTEVIEVLGVPSTATNDEKAGGSYVVGGYGAIYATRSTKSVILPTGESVIIPFLRKSTLKTSVENVFTKVAPLMGIAAWHISRHWPVVCSSLSALFEHHPITGAKFMYPTRHQQQQGWTSACQDTTRSCSIASNQVALRFAPLNEISSTDLVAFGQTWGGTRPVQVQTYVPGYICIVVLRSDKRLHCNAVNVSSATPSWNATGLHIDVGDYTGEMGMPLIYVPTERGLLKIIPYCRKPIYKFVRSMDMVTWASICKYESTKAITCNQQWTCTQCTYINDFVVTGILRCAICNRIGGRSKIKKTIT